MGLRINAPVFQDLNEENQQQLLQPNNLIRGAAAPAAAVTPLGAALTGVDLLKGLFAARTARKKAQELAKTAGTTREIANLQEGVQNQNSALEALMRKL